MRKLVTLTVLLALLAGVTAVCQGRGLPPAQRDAAKAAEEEDGGGESKGGGDEPEDPKKAEEEITNAVVYMFDGTKPEIEPKLLVIDRVDSIKEVALRVLAANAEVFKIITAEVKDIKFTSPTEADIVFDILVGGKPTVEGFVGKVMYRDGKWKLDPQMVCDLIAIADAKAAGECQPAPDTGAT